MKMQIKEFVMLAALLAVPLLAAIEDRAWKQAESSGPWTGYIRQQGCGRKMDRPCNKKYFDDGAPPVLVLDKYCGKA